jgi:hypothetical protein
MQKIQEKLQSQVAFEGNENKGLKTIIQSLQTKLEKACADKDKAQIEGDMYLQDLLKFKTNFAMSLDQDTDNHAQNKELKQ